ncbi:hypothetical protein H4R33_004517 [Dimargaris cristalligena]|nr:hypothetical protein H4R33_004517 [Dimargaris cristalligena]
MALANFTFGLPHGIGSVVTVANGEPGPHLFRRAQGQKRQATNDTSDYSQNQSASTSQVSLNNIRRMQEAVSQMESAKDLMDMMKTEADFSFFLATTYLPNLNQHSDIAEKSQLDPTLSGLRTNYIELEDWAENFGQVRTDDMDADAFHTLFPLVAQILDDGPSAISMLDALPMSASTPGFRSDYYTVASEFPGLAQTILPENLAQHTLSHMSNLAKGHLAAHYVSNDNVEGLIQIIRSWAPNDHQTTPAAPPIAVAAYSDKLDDMPDLIDSMADEDDSMDEEDEIINDPNRRRQFNPRDDSPLDNSGRQDLQNNKNRLLIATLYLWALEHQVSGYDRLLAEFGNPFRYSDIPCFLAFDYVTALDTLEIEYSDRSLLLNPNSQFKCYQSFSFQGYVTMAPSGVTDDKEIHVRYNRKLNPQVTAAPDNDNQILDKIIGDLRTLTTLSSDPQVQNLCLFEAYQT